MPVAVAESHCQKLPLQWLVCIGEFYHYHGGLCPLSQLSRFGHHLGLAEAPALVAVYDSTHVWNEVEIHWAVSVIQSLGRNAEK